MSREDQAAALEKMQDAFARQKALIDQLGVDDGPGNPGNLDILRRLMAAHREFEAAAEEFRAAGGSI